MQLRFAGPAGRFRLTGAGVDVEQGDTVHVDDETAEYLLENGNFEAVEASAGESDSEDDGGAEPPVAPSELTVDELEATLDESDYSDAELQALRAAEADGKDRSSALDAIDGHLEE